LTSEKSAIALRPDGLEWGAVVDEGSIFIRKTAEYREKYGWRSPSCRVYLLGKIGSRDCVHLRIAGMKVCKLEYIGVWADYNGIGAIAS